MIAVKRERLLENLAVAAAIGVLLLLVAAVDLFSRSAERAGEGEVLAASFSAAEASAVLETDDPSFARIYALRRSAPAYGAILSLRTSEGSARVAALFSPQGELRELRLVDSFADRLSEDRQAIAGRFPDADEAFARAAESVRAAARKAE